MLRVRFLLHSARHDWQLLWRLKLVAGHSPLQVQLQLHAGSWTTCSSMQTN